MVRKLDQNVWRNIRRNLDQNVWCNIRMQTSIGKVWPVWSFPTLPICLGAAFVMQHMTSTYNSATPPLPACSMLKIGNPGGMVKLTWFAQPLCQRVLDGNIGHRGDRGKGGRYRRYMGQRKV